MTWRDVLHCETETEYFKNLIKKVDEEYKKYTVYPPHKDIFRAFKITKYEDIKVVIIGQDPYHEKGQANGLAFSVNRGVKLPPSLRNIYREIENEYGCEMSKDGDLTSWAMQGVLLLNATLTVRDGLANSNKNIGWQKFTDKVIEKINENNNPIVFLLWGRFAQEKTKYITNKNHFILTAPHPSPLSVHRGFFGCGHFKKANEILKSFGITEIDWKI